MLVGRTLREKAGEDGGVFLNLAGRDEVGWKHGITVEEGREAPDIMERKT